MPTVQIGDTLSNGASVLAIRYSNFNFRDIGVLCLIRGEFVTWVANPDGSNTCWGEYYQSDLVRAVAAFEQRFTDTF